MNRPTGAIGRDCRACEAGMLSREDTYAECARHLTEASAVPGSRDVLTSEGPWQKFLAHSGQSRPMAPVGQFVSQRTGIQLCWNFLYHSRIVLSIGVSVWYLVLHLRGTAIIYSVLANSKTQNVFLSPVLAMFHHHFPLAVKPTSSPWRLLPKQTWRDSRLIDVLLSAVSLSWLLSCRVRKFRRDLWIILYVRFEVYTAMEIHIVIFRVITLCWSVADEYRLFGGICWIQLQGWSLRQYISQRMSCNTHGKVRNTYKIISVSCDEKKTTWKIYK
jgi:hypothetical protein